MTRGDAARLIAINILVSALLVITFHGFTRPKQPAFATLDVAELYRLKESEIAARLVAHTASDADRAAALQRAATFGAEVSAVLEALPKECRCLILTRSAVVGDDAPLPDLTPAVRQRLGLVGAE